MTALLRVSISLDGKLLDNSEKPLRGGLPFSKVAEAMEIELTIHPLIVGGDFIPTLSAPPGAFLPEELRWDLLSAVNGPAGTIVVSYRRK